MPDQSSVNENTTSSLMKPNFSIPRAIARHVPILPAVMAFVSWLTPCATAAELEENPAAAIQHYNLGNDKVALSGYDPVGYFTLNKALKGRNEINSQHRGVTYWFASEENKKLFTESPAKYLPTYGGWCATAMAKGEKVEIDPTNFKVTNGRLFLFFKAFYANAIKDWNKDESGQTVKADANWKKIAGE
jgi:YHS domain-containing protein